MKELGVCKLCREEKPLLKKSHIIQKALHKYLKSDGEQHFLSVSTSMPSSPDLIGDGLYEGNILCLECDNNRLGRIESRGMKIFNRLSKIVTSENDRHYTDDKNFYIEVNDLNYKDLKLWVLIHLWRASIAKKKFFSEVSLSEKHEEELRSMILNENAGCHEEYPFVVFCYSMENHVYQGTIIPPRCLQNVEGNILYALYFCGFLFYIFISSRSHKMSDDIIMENLRLEEERCLKIFNFPEDEIENFTIETFIGNSRK